MRIRLDIAYDGTHFRGWARQPGLRTVQGTLEDALARILGGDPRLVVAGRTDAGVHATGQVAHVDLDEDQQLRLAARRPRPADDVDGEPLRRRARRARLSGVVGAYPDVIVHRSTPRPGRIRRALLGGVAPVRIPHRRPHLGLRPARAASHDERPRLAR